MDLIVALLREEERDINRRWQKNVNIIRRSLRDTQNPFDVSDNTFLKLYRLSKAATVQLIEELKNFMPVPQRKTAIPQLLQVFAILHFLASGSYQRKVGQDFLSCMSQTSISVSIHATVNALNNIMGHWIQFPTTDRRKQEIKQEFFENTGFPGVIGAIDGTHIAIFPPQTEREHLFINRKQYHSLNVMIVCSYNNEILTVNAMHGGRTHDSRVFRSSAESNYEKYISNLMLYNKAKIPRIDNYMLGLMRDHFLQASRLFHNGLIFGAFYPNPMYHQKTLSTGYIPPEAFIYLDQKKYLQDENGIPIIYHYPRRNSRKKITYPENTDSNDTSITWRYDMSIPDQSNLEKKKKKIDLSTGGMLMIPNLC
ncbi:Putative nuclease HARBI1 [Trachymyrmex cornetzi]|uniref:Putative nuclease HARBI1 n=1 Tax=Trachymyrmex cornetzi TaxID=471704 RepID=A0A151J461_9HYME|nr:Putative nuclease HARBI1 [Trachymyrmex cornetzi]